MEILSPEFRTRWEEMNRKVEKLEGKIASLEFSSSPIPTRKRNLVDVKQLAKETGVSIPTLIRHRNAGLIEGLRFGGRVLYDLDEVLSSMKSTRRK